MNTTIIILGFIAIAVSVIWGTKFKTNVGIAAIVFAFILGLFGVGMKASDIYAFWPARTTVQLIIVTAFFGFAVENGTINYIAEQVIYRTRRIPWAIPIVYLLLNFALSVIGVSPPAVNMFLIPIFITLCYSTKTNELFLSIGSNAGGMSGTLCSIGMVGIMLSGMISAADETLDTSMIVMHVFRTATIVFFILFAIYYFALRLYKMNLPEDLIQKPKAPTKEQKRNIVVIIVCILFLFVPAVINTFAPNPVMAKISNLDISLVYAAGMVALTLLKCGNEREVIKKSIPWSVIILLGGMTCLMGVMRTAGLSDMIVNAVTGNVSLAVIPVLVVLLSGVLSLFSDGTSVVMPLMIPIVVSLSSATGLNPAMLIACVCIPAIGMGMSPFSTGGGVFLSFVKEDRFQKMMIQSLIAVLCNLGIMCALCAVGILR